MSSAIDNLQKELDAINASLSELPVSKVRSYAPMEHEHPHGHPYAKDNHGHKTHEHPFAPKHDHPYSKEHDHPYAKEKHEHKEYSHDDHKHSEKELEKHSHKELEIMLSRYISVVDGMKGQLKTIEEALQTILGKPESVPPIVNPPSGWDFDVKDASGKTVQKITADRKG